MDGTDQVGVKAETPEGGGGLAGGGHQLVDGEGAGAVGAVSGVAVNAAVSSVVVGGVKEAAAPALPVFGGLGVPLPLVGGALEHAGAAGGAAAKNLRQHCANIRRVDKGNLAGVAAGLGVGGMRPFNGPGFVQRADAVAEPSVDGAFGGEQGGQGFAALADVVKLMAHHHTHNAAPPVGGLHGNIGHAGHDGVAARCGHFQAVRIGAAHDVAPVVHGDGARQVKVGAQRRRVVIQAVAVGPGFGPEPLLKIGVAYGGQFQHPVPSLRRLNQRCIARAAATILTDFGRIAAAFIFRWFEHRSVIPAQAGICGCRRHYRSRQITTPDSGLRRNDG